MRRITVTADGSAPPEWAVLQQRLIAGLLSAAPEYVERYCRPDGTLRWRSEWAGMDGSDDPYEAFMYLALLAALTGEDEITALAHRVWDSITWQWTEYGQIDREFDRYYDWMHHGESSLYLYFLGLTRPESLVDRQRAARFAAMYTGDDPLAPNYDPELNIIRAPHTGSDGPRFEISPEDLSTHRAVLADYPPPFGDLAGRDWLDDRDFAAILAAMNERTMRGDVALNLNATTLVAHAHLYDGSHETRDWVLRYRDGWARRAVANGGILPDNVGLGGQVGEYLGGRWWGGHYGWSWPHGLITVVEPALNAALNAHLLTGDASALGLVRDQLDALYDLGETRDGLRFVPHKHTEEGWGDMRRASPVHAIQLWSRTLADEDRERVERTPALPEETEARVPRLPFTAKHYNVNSVAWYRFATGSAPEYPVAVLEAGLELLEQQLRRMRSPDGDPAGWDRLERLADQVGGPSLQTDGYAIHAWQEFCPIYFESLIQLQWGAPAHISHGGLQFATLRYLDLERGRAGLPVGVSALVSRIDADGATLELVNTSQVEARVGVQGGAFREHRIRTVAVDGAAPQVIDSMEFEVDLGVGARVALRLELDRVSAPATYATAVSPRSEWPPLLRGRREG